MSRNTSPTRSSLSVLPSTWTNWIKWLIPLILVSILMAPRLISPNFGLLDDGNLIRASRSITAGNFELRDLGSGRYRPAYWLHWALIYFLGGENPFWFFVGNAIELGLTLGGIIVLIRLQGCRNRQAWISSLIFLFAGPVIENYYTLSKGEADQVLWLVLSLILITLLPRMKRRYQTALAIVGSAIFVFMAAISKETTVVMLPISLGWCVLEWIRVKKGGDKRGLQARMSYFLLTAIILGVFLLLRARAVGYLLAGQKYTQEYTQAYNLQLVDILASIVRWIGWLVRDFSYLAPLFLILGLLLLGKRSHTKDYLWQDSLVWMVGWVAIFLPWGYMVGYYMLPFAIGASFFVGQVVEMGVNELATVKKHLSLTLKMLFSLSGVLLLISLVNNLTTARIQLVVDEANAELVSYLSEKIPQESRLLVNIQDPNEYFNELKVYLSVVYDRDDIEVDYVRPLDLDKAMVETLPTYVVLANITNQPLLTVRLGVHEPTLINWNNSIQEYIYEGEIVFQTTKRFTMFSIDLPRLFCPVLRNRGFCVTQSPLLDMREFLYGWEIVRLENTGVD